MADRAGGGEILDGAGMVFIAAVSQRLMVERVKDRSEHVAQGPAIAPPGGIDLSKLLGVREVHQALLHLADHVFQTTCGVPAPLA